MDRRARSGRVARPPRRARHGRHVQRASVPNTPARWGDRARHVRAGTGGTAKLTWVPRRLAREARHGAAKTRSRSGSPPVGKFAGFHRWKNARARAAGLTFRSIDDTVKALLAWFPKEIERRARVTRELDRGREGEGRAAAEAGRSDRAARGPTARARSRATRGVSRGPLARAGGRSGRLIRSIAFFVSISPSSSPAAARSVASSSSVVSAWRAVAKPLLRLTREELEAEPLEQRIDE